MVAHQMSERNPDSTLLESTIPRTIPWFYGDGGEHRGTLAGNLAG